MLETFNHIEERVCVEQIIKLESFFSQYNCKYGFVDNDQWLDAAAIDPKAASAQYWLEMLFRSHMAAVSSLLRSHAWLQGMHRGIADRNVLVFAASMRGFAESASDTVDGLGSVAITLADNFRRIDSILEGRIKTFATAG